MKTFVRGVVPLKPGETAIQNPFGIRMAEGFREETDEEFRQRIIASMPHSPSLREIVESVLHPIRFKIKEERTTPLVTDIFCPDASEKEMRDIADRIPIVWNVTINGQPISSFWRKLG
jgi:hypothetical protein